MHQKIHGKETFSARAYFSRTHKNNNKNKPKNRLDCVSILVCPGLGGLFLPVGQTPIDESGPLWENMSLPRTRAHIHMHAES